MKILPTIYRSKKNMNVVVEEKDEPLQLDLGLKESPLNRLYEVRQKLEKLEDRLRLSNYWRNPMIWIMILFPLVCMLIFYRYAFAAYKVLPESIPLIWANPELSTILAPKPFIIIIPAVTLLCSVITAIFVRMSYRKLEKFIFIFMISYIILSVLGYLVCWNVLKTFIFM
jgi:hypothetical protein